MNVWQGGAFQREFFKKIMKKQIFIIYLRLLGPKQGCLRSNVSPQLWFL
jgi:hypothetical protein